MKTHEGPVRASLHAMGASEAVLAEWDQWVDQVITPEDDEDF